MEKWTPERWRRAQELIDTILDLPQDRRAAFLDEHCPDPELRPEVEALLAQEEELEKNGFMAVPAVTLRPPDAFVGRRIGPYRIDRLIDRGGMGAVYLAAREDDYRQQVALKLIRFGLGDELAERFHRERQILARLVHPGIARLLDGGTTEDGLPYLVMEHIEGVPIDHWAREHGVRARLELFRQVCAAVTFAHRNLVVHRDLKPANILVTAEGVPKLLDFGIAKLLDAQDPGNPLTYEQGPMTLQYASPEQVKGEPITTSSDVYALGVLLHKLLTDRLPCELDQRTTLTGMMLAICKDEPRSPSTLVRHASAEGEDATVLAERRRLVRRLRGDLDAIVLKALRKEPEERYASVEQLAEDVRRHLEGEPVAARRGTFVYRAGKFVRRHRLATATLALGLAFSVATTVLWSRAERERERAMSLSGFLRDLFRVVDPERRETVVLPAAEILERGRAYLGDEPEEQANLLVYAGRALQKSEHLEEARLLLSEALELRRQTFGEDDEQTARAHAHLGSVLQDLHDLGAAKEHYERNLAWERRHGSPDLRELAKMVNNLGTLLYERREYAEAEKLFREVLEIRRRTGTGDDGDPVRTLNNLAACLDAQGRAEEAEALYREGLEIRQRRLGSHHWEVAHSLYGLGVALARHGKVEEGEDLLRRSLAIRQEIYGDEHPDVARTQVALAKTLAQRGGGREAEALYREALVFQERTLPADHPDLISTRKHLAALLVDRGDPAAAEPLILAALASLRAVERGDGWEVAEAESVLGACLVDLGRVEEGRRLLAASVQALEENRGRASREAREARRRLERASGSGEPPPDAGTPAPQPPVG